LIVASHDELTKIGVIFVRLYFKYFIFIWYLRLYKIVC